MLLLSGTQHEELQTFMKISNRNGWFQKPLYLHLIQSIDKRNSLNKNETSEFDFDVNTTVSGTNRLLLKLSKMVVALCAECQIAKVL